MIIGSSSHSPPLHIITVNCLSQFHYSLGMSLYSITNGKVADDMLFSIADQIKYGIGNLDAEENPELRIEIATLYGLAGAKAVASSDHAASCSYLETALSLLPTDRWKSQYDLSLRFSLQWAKSRYSCGDIEKAEHILQEVTGNCHTIQDKLPTLSLLARSKYNFWRVKFLICLIMLFATPDKFSFPQFL